MQKDDGLVAKSWTERALIEGCRRGDRRAQRQLYARTSERIFRLLLKLTHNRDDALDLAQTAYLHAFARIDGFDGGSTLTTWLYRIATNEALQFLRHKRVEQKALPLVAAQTKQTSDNAEDQTRLDVADALASLPVDDRALAVLRFEEGLDYAAIAEVLGCPVGTVASRLNKVRRSLRALLLKGGYGTNEEFQVSGHQMDRGSAGGADSGEAVRPHAGGSRAAP